MATITITIPAGTVIHPEDGSTVQKAALVRDMLYYQATGNAPLAGPDDAATRATIANDYLLDWVKAQTKIARRAIEQSVGAIATAVSNAAAAETTAVDSITIA